MQYGREVFPHVFFRLVLLALFLSQSVSAEPERAFHKNGLINEAWLKNASKEEVHGLTRALALRQWEKIDRPLISKRSEDMIMVATREGTTMINAKTGKSVFVPLLDPNFKLENANQSEVETAEKSGSNCIDLFNQYNITTASYYNLCILGNNEDEDYCMAMEDTLDSLWAAINQHCKHLMYE